MSVPSPTNSSHLLIQLYCCEHTVLPRSVAIQKVDSQLPAESICCQRGAVSCSNSREMQSYNILEHLIDAQHHQHAARIWDDCMAACLH